MGTDQEERYGHVVAVLLGDTLIGLCYVGPGKPFTARICPEAPVELLLRRGGKQKNSQERRSLPVNMTTCQRASEGQQWLGVLSCLLLEVRFYEYAKRADSK